MHQVVLNLQRWRDVTWIMDRGLDDVAVWRTLWEQDEQLVCRVQPSECLSQYQPPAVGGGREM